MKMTINELLNNQSHRPWEIPSGNWKFYQEWNEAVFLHWHVDYKELSKLVHPDLEIDLFESQPWVSLVAFNMERIRPKNLPSFSPISFFSEINIRTYVKYNGKAGVHFLSIEGAKKLSCKLAKSLSELPYRFSAMTRTEDSFISDNMEFGDSLSLHYTVGQKMEDKQLIDLWLTERYALFQNTEKYINEFEIHHIEWPVFELELKEIEIKYPRFDNLLVNFPDKKHYSAGVQVIAWGKKRYKIAVKSANGKG
jgi:uncharacterized protein